MTTPHADRDRSEPWWPPGAPRTYAVDADEPVPFLLTDEPQGELVRCFPLDEGDPGTPLLPVAPGGVLLQCIMCPATLADTAGGWLVHHDDGSHTYEPSSAPAANPLHEMPDQGAAVTVADDHRMRAQIRTLAGALRTEAQGLRVDTFLRPANVTTAIFLENVADMLVAEVGP